MRYLIVTLLGLAAGVAAGGTALYYNPLTQGGTPPSAAENLVLEYGFPLADSMILTHGGTRALPTVPTDVNELWEGAIKKIMLNAVTLRGPDGSGRALATRVSVPSAQTNLLLTGAPVADYWLVTVPGEGSFFVHVRNNLWPFVKDVVIPIQYLGRTWQGPVQYDPTVGPRADQAGAVFGATGRYAETRGTARMSYRLDSFSRARGVEAALGRLHLDLAQLKPRGEELSQAELE